MGWNVSLLKSAHFHGGSGPHLIRGYLVPRDSAPNGLSIGSAIFAQPARMPNTQTRRPCYMQHL